MSLPEPNHETYVPLPDGRNRYSVPRRLRHCVLGTPARMRRNRVLLWVATALVVLGIAAAPVAVTQATFPATVDLGSLTSSSNPPGSFQQGTADNDEAGTSVTTVGDFNGDGFDDVAIGAPKSDPSSGRTDAGEVYILFGRAAGIPSFTNVAALNGSTGIVLQGATAGDDVGRAVSGAGDVNGDGFDDIIIGAPGANEISVSLSSGVAYVVFGKADWTSDVTNTLDSTFFDNGNNGFELLGTSSQENVGNSVSGAGDIDNDGFDDIIVSGSGASPNGGSSGSAYVVFGKSNWFGFASSNLNSGFLDGNNGFILEGEVFNQRVGSSVSGAGDVNNDGFDDMLVGTQETSATINGTAFLVYGKMDWSSDSTNILNSTFLNGINGITLSGGTADVLFGRAVVSDAGDVNNDGFADMLVGAEVADPNGSNSGAAYLIFGGNSLATTIDVTALNGSTGVIFEGKTSSERVGFSLSSAGDINGDGFADMIIGAYKASLPDIASGGAYVVYGKGNWTGTANNTLNSSFLDGTNGFTLQGEDTSDQAGWSVSGAGDVNNDGADEVIVGARLAEGGGSQRGKSYIVLGDAPIATATPTATTAPPTATATTAPGKPTATTAPGKPTATTAPPTATATTAPGKPTATTAPGKPTATTAPPTATATTAPGKPTATPTAEAVSLTLNFTTGRAGSAFVATGKGLLPNTTYEVQVNGVVVTTVTTDANGQVSVVLLTGGASPNGTYTVTLVPVAATTQNTDLSASFTIDAAAPLRAVPDGNTAPVAEVPESIAPAEGGNVYLPFVIKN